MRSYVQWFFVVVLLHSLFSASVSTSHNCCACLVLFFVLNENSLKVRGLRLFEGQDFLTGLVKLLNIYFSQVL